MVLKQLCLSYFKIEMRETFPRGQFKIVMSFMTHADNQLTLTVTITYKTI